MQDGVQLKYGQIRGGSLATKVTMAASQNIQDASGRFVYMNAGAATLCTDGTTSIFGSLESEKDTVTAADVRNCIIDLTAVFRIPVDSGTYAIGMVGDSCDINITSNIQGAQLDASVENTLIVVGGDAVNNNWVDVMMSPLVWGTGIGVDA